MPVASGDVFVATSAKDGYDNALDAEPLFPLSRSSPGFASASFHSPVSLSRESFQLFVGLAAVTETDFNFSTLNHSFLSSHSSGFASTLENGSVTRETVCTSEPTIT